MERTFTLKPPMLKAVEYDGTNAAEITTWSGGALVDFTGVSTGDFAVLSSGNYMFMDSVSLFESWQEA